MRPKVKICGLMNANDRDMCIRYGADILGFVVEYPQPVPWNLSLEAAKELITAVSGRCKTCVVTGGKPNKILQIAKELRPDFVQLHYRETLEETRGLVVDLEALGIKTIKTLFPNTPDLEQTARDFCATGAYGLLFDPRTPENASQGGAVDLTVFNSLRQAVSCPMILAGGITPENVIATVEQTNAQIIDLMSGVELSPGHKDEKRLNAFFKALQGI